MEKDNLGIVLAQRRHNILIRLEQFIGVGLGRNVNVTKLEEGDVHSLTHPGVEDLSKRPTLRMCIAVHPDSEMSEHRAVEDLGITALDENKTPPAQYGERVH